MYQCAVSHIVLGGFTAKLFEHTQKILDQRLGLQDGPRGRYWPSKLIACPSDAVRDKMRSASATQNESPHRAWQKKENHFAIDNGAVTASGPAVGECGMWDTPIGMRRRRRRMLQPWFPGLDLTQLTSFCSSSAHSIVACQHAGNILPRNRRVDRTARARSLVRVLRRVTSCDATWVLAKKGRSETAFQESHLGRGGSLI